ncbi:4Fe-4S binding protein [Vibrio breoganii]
MCPFGIFSDVLRALFSFKLLVASLTISGKLFCV